MAAVHLRKLVVRHDLVARVEAPAQGPVRRLGSLGGAKLQVHEALRGGGRRAGCQVSQAVRYEKQAGWLCERKAVSRSGEQCHVMACMHGAALRCLLHFNLQREGVLGNMQAHNIVTTSHNTSTIPSTAHHHTAHHHFTAHGSPLQAHLAGGVHVHVQHRPVLAALIIHVPL